MTTFMIRSIAGSLALAAMFCLSTLEAQAGGLLGQEHVGWGSGGTSTGSGGSAAAGASNTTARSGGAAATRTPPFAPPQGPGRELHKMVATIEYCILRADGQRMWFRRPYTTSYYDANSKTWVSQDWRSQVEYAITSLHTGGHVVVSVTPISHTHAVVVY